MQFHAVLQRTVYCCLTSLLAIMLVSYTVTTAQSEPMRLLLSADGIGGLFWSYQGRYLRYRAPAFTIGTVGYDEYYAYDVVLHATYGEHVPDPYPLSRDDYRRFGTGRIGLGSVASVSPDGRYIVYSKTTAPYPDADDPTYVIAIGDRTTGESISTSITDFSGLTSQWNATSTAFVLYSFGSGYGSPYYFPVALAYNLFTGLEHPLTRELYEFSAQDRQFSFGDTVDPYPIDASGRYLLAIVSDSNYSSTLIRFDADDPSNSKVIRNDMMLDDDLGENLKAFSFYLGDASKVLMVTKRGVVEVNVDTGQETIIQPQLTAEWVEEIVFSPGGQWLAFTHFNEELGQAELYLLDVATDLTANLFTPTPTATPTETDYPTDTPTITMSALTGTRTPLAMPR